MSQISPARNSPPLAGVRLRRLLRESFGFLTCALAILLAMALWSFDPKDPGWRLYVQSIDHIENLVGRLGAWLADLLLYFFGYAAWLLPLAFAWSGVRLMLNRDWLWPEAWLRLTLFFLFLLIFGVLCSLHLPYTPIDGVFAGGVVGGFLTRPLYDFLGMTGATLLLLIALPVVASLYLERSLLALTDKTGEILIRTANFVLELSGLAARQCLRLLLALIAALRRFSRLAVNSLRWGSVYLGGKLGLFLSRLRRLRLRRADRASPANPALAPERFVPDPLAPRAPESPRLQRQPRTSEALATPRTQKSATRPPAADRAGQKKGGKKEQRTQKDLWQDELPPHSLLTHEQARAQSLDQGYHDRRAAEIIQHLSDFGVKAEVAGALSGPVVTRYEIQPAAGVKASKITALSSDLARSLSVQSVRVVEVIPGKTVVGLELPNQKRQMVRLAEIINSDEWRQAGGGLPLALGMDIAGAPVVSDLSRMPHLLVAGTTGSGKSVSVNTMMISLLYHGPSSLIRMIMIDPKMLELSAYEGIPQLLTPVITDMRQAGRALSWCVREMDRRYALMAAVGVRNLQGYNHKIKMAQQRNQALEDPRIDPDNPESKQTGRLEKLPYIVVVIDEYADMMMVVGKKVETLIMRLSQKARAAGIHLILATQRPSVDVVTGLIKSNIPNRIAFQVSSRIDSRTILDQAGAEQLLGHGDMLMIRPGMKFPLRVHGAFVSDDEVHRVVDYLRLHAPECNYSEDVLATPPGEEENGGSPVEASVGEEEDHTYAQAVKIVRESGRASISYLQRRLRIGYNRSASLLERMERAGIVSALQSGGTREVIGARKSE